MELQPRKNIEFRPEVRKSIPMLPYLWGDGSADGFDVIDCWDCPSCNTTYEIETDRYNYCPNCGQKIDRSELDEMA